MATGLEQHSQDTEGDEIIEVVKLPLHRALEMAHTGEICDGKSVLGLMAAKAWMVNS
jgi:ADP-ribose pyrophosphatase